MFHFNSNGASNYLNGSNNTNSNTINGHNNNGTGINNTKSLSMKFNSQSMINIANGKTMNGHPQHHYPPSHQSSRSSSPNIHDRLKEEILHEIRQELSQFKQDLLTGLFFFHFKQNKI